MQAEGGKRNTKHSLVGAKLDVNHFFSVCPGFFISTFCHLNLSELNYKIILLVYYIPKPLKTEFFLMYLFLLSHYLIIKGFP